MKKGGHTQASTLPCPQPPAHFCPPWLLPAWSPRTRLTAVFTLNWFRVGMTTVLWLLGASGSPTKVSGTCRLGHQVCSIHPLQRMNDFIPTLGSRQNSLLEFIKVKFNVNDLFQITWLIKCRAGHWGPAGSLCVCLRVSSKP